LPVRHDVVPAPNILSPGRSIKPQVLLVAPYYAPSCYGGAVQLYHQMLIRLQALKAVVVTQRQDRGDVRVLEQFDRSCPRQNGYEVRRIQRFELAFAPSATLASRLVEAGQFFVRTSREWRAVLCAVRPDVVICGATYIAGWLMGQVPGAIPLINYLHGEELAAASASRFLRPLLFRAQMRAMRRAAVNIAVSRYTADRAAELAGIARDRIVILPNFVDTERFSPPPDKEKLRRELGWQGKRIILSLARLTPRKGIDQAIRAIAQLKRAGRLPADWVHIIAGAGEQERELRALAEQTGANAYTRFEGFIPEAKVPSYLGAADIFLQPNRDIAGNTEGFGIVFIEASACGTPVIGGVAGGTADAIYEGITGFRVNAEDLSSISHAIDVLIHSDQLRRDMGVAGIEIVRRNFGVGPAVRRFEAVVLGVLDQQRRPH